MAKIQETSMNSSDLQSQWADGPFIEWLQQNGKNILLGAALAIISIFLIYRYFAGSAQQAEADYYTAENEYALLLDGAQNPQDAEHSLEQLQKILMRRPELEARYSGALAQLLIANGQPSIDLERQAIKYLDDKRLALYQAYANTTIAITENEVQRALEETNALKKQLLENPKSEGFGAVLLSYIYLREASLQRQLGTKEQENQAWIELKKLLASKDHGEEVKEALSHFGQGPASIQNYIEARLASRS